MGSVNKDSLLRLNGAKNLLFPEDNDGSAKIKFLEHNSQLLNKKLICFYPLKTKKMGKSLKIGQLCKIDDLILAYDS